MRGIWLPSLKQFVTGTLVGSDYGLDVNIVNTSLPIALTALVYKEHRFMDAAVTNIPASGGTAVQIGDTNIPAADVANTCTQLKVANNSGSAINIYVGANSGALTQIGVAHAGQIGEAVFGVTLASGDKVWIRAVQNAAITSGEVLVTLLGA